MTPKNAIKYHETHYRQWQLPVALSCRFLHTTGHSWGIAQGITREEDSAQLSDTYF